DVEEAAVLLHRERERMVLAGLAGRDEQGAIDGVGSDRHRRRKAAAAQQRGGCHDREMTHVPLPLFFLPSVAPVRPQAGCRRAHVPLGPPRSGRGPRGVRRRQPASAPAAGAGGAGYCRSPPSRMSWIWSAAVFVFASDVWLPFESWLLPTMTRAPSPASTHMMLPALVAEVVPVPAQTRVSPRSVEPADAKLFAADRASSRWRMNTAMPAGLRGRKEDGDRSTCPWAGTAHREAARVAASAGAGTADR